MPCFHPLHGYRARTVNASGKRSIVFNKKEGFSDLPVEVPCGACIGCRIDRSQQWAVRCMNEAQFHEFKCFVTLTYNNEHMPHGGSLLKSDFQKFMKRLRKKYTGMTIRYYMCGEYGDNLGRPHYHALLYGIDFPDKKRHSGTDEKTLYVSETLDKIWGLGFCTIGALTHQSAAYVARYVMKKITGERANEHYRYVIPSTGEIIWRLSEYNDMSRRPGIGSTFFKQFKSDLYPSDFTIVKGKKTPVPKYYDRQLEKENPNLLAQIKSKRIRKASTPKNKANNTWQRLEVRKTCLEARIKILKRNID